MADSPTPKLAKIQSSLSILLRVTIHTTYRFLHGLKPILRRATIHTTYSYTSLGQIDTIRRTTTLVNYDYAGSISPGFMSVFQCSNVFCDFLTLKTQKRFFPLKIQKDTKEILGY